MADKKTTTDKLNIVGLPDDVLTKCVMEVTHAMQVAALVTLSQKYMDLMGHHERILGSAVATLLAVTEKHFPGMGNEIVTAFRDPAAYKLMADRTWSADTSKMN